jgi:hypothetical protein
MTDRSYIERNERERKRLQALVARLTDRDLARAMSGGWTIAGVLGHVAWWDQRIVALVEQWRGAGVGSAPVPFTEAAHVDWINDASKPFLHAVAPRRAAELAVAIAEAADRAVAALPDEYVDRNAALGAPINLDRAEHRREHLDEIEAALAS